MIKVEMNGTKDSFLIEVPFQWTKHVRPMPTRRYMKSMDKWRAPAMRRNVQYIVEKWMHNPDIDVRVSGEALDVINQVMNAADANKHKWHKIPKDYSFKTKPFAHQNECYMHTLGLHSMAIMAEQGLGKSKMASDISAIYEYRMGIKNILIICPFGIRNNWIGELITHHPLFNSESQIHCVDTKTKAGRERALKFINTPSDEPKAVVVGHESLQQCEVRKEGRKKVKIPTGNAFGIIMQYVGSHAVVAVNDESHNIKNHSSNRWISEDWIGRRCPVKIIMTGTPIGVGPLDLYAQYNWLDPNIIGMDWYSFRSRYSIMGGYEGKQVVGYQNIDELMQLLKPYTFYATKESALDLPPKIYRTVKVRMTPKQEKIYKKLKKDRMAEISVEGATIETAAEHVLVVRSFLSMILSGYIPYKNDPDDKSEPYKYEPIFSSPKENPKYQAMLAEADVDPTKKRIVWFQFRKEISDFVQLIKEAYGEDSVVEYHGGVDGVGRQEALDKFKNGKAMWFVGNRTASTGLTLNESNDSWYGSNTNRLVDRLQSEDRNHRIGQDSSVLYTDFVYENTVDMDSLRSCYMKKDLADVIKEKLRDGSDIHDVIQ